MLYYFVCIPATESLGATVEEAAKSAGEKGMLLQIPLRTVHKMFIEAQPTILITINPKERN